jgi:hypothetical protein
MLGVGHAIIFRSIKVITTWFTREELFKANGILISGAPIGMDTWF